MVFFSEPSRGCDAIRSSNSDGLSWLLMERIRKRSAPVDESHRQWPFTRDLRWAVLYWPRPPVVGWDLTRYRKAALFQGFAVPDVSEPASQLLTAHLTNSLFAQEALL